MTFKQRNLLITIVFMVISTLVSFYIAYNTNHVGYKYLYIHPILYGIMYILFISPIRKRLNNIYIHVFIAVSFTRYVILPMLITISGNYGGRSLVPPLDANFQKAIFLMSYELIIVSFFTYLIFSKLELKNSNQLKEINISKSHFIYFIFIGISLSLGLLFPESLKSFAFLQYKEDFMDLGSGSVLITLITYSLVVSKFLTFIILMSFFYRRYNSTKNIVYIIASIIAIFLNISIFFGDNRSDYIITTIASILLFARLYPKYIKYSIIPLLLVSIIVISIINNQRDHVGVTGGTQPLTDLADNLQVYLAGPYNVAIALEATEINNSNRNTLYVFHELLRPVIGLNVFLKEIDIKPSSNYFNERIYFSDHKTQIIPMIGQGYFYFGFLLSPIITILYLFIVRYLMVIQSRKNRIELIFFFSIPIARIGFATAQNGSILANDISFFLALFLIVFYLNRKIVLRKF